MSGLLSAEELAPLIGIHCQTVLRWKREGVIPAAIDRGRFVRFELEPVMEALREQAEEKRKERIS